MNCGSLDMALADHQSDGLNDRSWERLRVVVTAANAGDRKAFEGEVRSWRSDISLGEQQRIGLYLLALVKYMTRRSLMGEPGESDLRNLATRCFPDVSRVLTVHTTAVEDTLRTAFGRPSIGREHSPGELVIVSAAIVGSLLTKPADEIAGMREYVAEWWRVNARNVRNSGVRDN